MIKLKNILNESVLIQRRSKEERLKYHRAFIYKKIRKYIKNGCVGGLDLSEAPIEYLPDEITKIGGNLDLSNTQIKKLQDGLKVEGSLYLSNTPITSLPSGLKKVDGNLWVDGTQISSLPDELEIMGELWMDNCPITEYPINVIVHQTVDIRGTKITKLPDNLTINNDLKIINTNIYDIPNNLNILGCLFLQYTPLAEKYSSNQIKQMIINKGGSVGGNIFV